ncbi:hypothetical protein N7445_009864 [Penicillium cf. griseofulvum]|nr:hypothetical protein N7445_009864 [Penicillium cf. griseofulvum]
MAQLAEQIWDSTCSVCCRPLVVVPRKVNRPNLAPKLPFPNFVLRFSRPSEVTESQSYERGRIPLPLLRKQVSADRAELLDESENARVADDKKQNHVILGLAFRHTAMKATPYPPPSTTGILASIDVHGNTPDSRNTPIT